MPPPALKAAVTPRMNADNDIGQWNTFDLTVKGSDVTLFLNGKNVIPTVTLSDLPAEGSNRAAAPWRADARWWLFRHPRARAVQEHLHQGASVTRAHSERNGR